MSAENSETQTNGKLPPWPSAEEITVMAFEAVQQDLLVQKKLGLPIVVFRDGQVLKISPDDIAIQHASGNNELQR